MQYLNFQVSSSTVRKILDDYGIIPDPEKRSRGDWEQFRATQEAVTAAIDYAQTEIVTPFMHGKRELFKLKFAGEVIFRWKFPKNKN